MSNKVKDVSSFVSEVLARITGDTDKAIAKKNERKARSAYEGQLAALKGSRVDLEDDLETANDNYNAIVYPVTPLVNREQYIDNIFIYKNHVTSAEEALETNAAKTKLLQGLLDNM